ncbi:MAG TPA: hypothetical protein VHB20_07930 [Verrucomicrobiae bacterium]|jgi:N-acetylglutamate synthase-like GNAT family acetyltransferase|nr:hypothetical protein [Verrucomicrobiae bacterium]
MAIDSGPTWRVRRATVDDLPALQELWQAAHLTGDEQAFTDFQVAEDQDGKLAAAMALQIIGHAGRLHTETIADFGLTDILRPMLWERLLSVAKNHGLILLWTQENAPFWKKDAGFAPPPPEAKPKFPEGFGTLDDSWRMLRLREDVADPEFIERQFQAFKVTEQAKREKMLGQVRPLKWIGLGIAGLLLVLGFAAVVRVIMELRRH